MSHITLISDYSTGLEDAVILASTLEYIGTKVKILTSEKHKNIFEVTDLPQISTSLIQLWKRTKFELHLVTSDQSKISPSMYPNGFPNLEVIGGFETIGDDPSESFFGTDPESLKTLIDTVNLDPSKLIFSQCDYPLSGKCRPLLVEAEILLETNDIKRTEIETITHDYYNVKITVSSEKFEKLSARNVVGIRRIAFILNNQVVAAPIFSGPMLSSQQIRVKIGTTYEEALIIAATLQYNKLRSDWKVVS